MTDKTTLPEPVVRYDASTIMWSIGGNTLVPSSTGEFVRHADHASALQEALDRADRAESEFVRLHGPCSLGVGCDQYGVCYADAHGKPENCGKPAPIVCDALSDARRIADHDKKLWLAAESRATTAEAALEGARKVIERSAEGWENAIEMGIIAKQHITSAGILRDEARAWLSANTKETT